MIDQTAKHFSERKVIGVKVHLADGRIIQLRAPGLAGFRGVPALGIVFIVLFFEEQYTIWIPERQNFETWNYTRIMPEDVAIADHFWIDGDGTMGDHYRYGLMDTVPATLDPTLHKLGQMVDDQTWFNAKQNEVHQDNIWL